MKSKLLSIGSIILAAIVLVSCSQNVSPNQEKELTQLNLRLQRFPQAQFAGYLVADAKGFYAAEGLDVAILPAGPDLKPQTTVANGTDDIGIGVANQVITAQSNGVPLVTIAQIFQDSPNRYILKKENSIQDLSELKGEKIGLRMGGDEAEFISMLATVDMSLSDVQVVPQGYTIIPFLEDQYKISMVTSYNELQQVLTHIPASELQILHPGDYNSAIPADNVFTTQHMIDTRSEDLVRFLNASIQGWKYAIEHPEEAVDIILSYNQELTKEEQTKQLQAVVDLVGAGQAKEEGLGYIDVQAYENIQKILRLSNQLDHDVDVAKTYTLSIWDQIPTTIKKLK